MFGLFFNKQKVIQQAQQEVFKKWEAERQSRIEEIKKIKEFELEEFLGKLVICVSNEIQNITVGYGKEITYITKANEPMLVVHDIVNNQDVMPFGLVFMYTEQKFQALNKLEPNERIAILYNRSSDFEVDKSSSQTDEVIPSEEWAKKVEKAISVWKQEAAK